jgi:hypothetical protein
MPCRYPQTGTGPEDGEHRREPVTLRLLAVNLAERRPLRVGELLRDPPA